MKKPNDFSRFATALVIASFAALLGASAHSLQHSPPPGESAQHGKAAKVPAKPKVPADQLRRIKTGKPFGDFLLTSAQGDEIQGSDYQNRTLVLVYLSAEQRNSERAAADASRVVGRYAEQAVDLLFATADFGSESYFEAFLKEAKINAPLGFDGGHALYSRLGLIVFPSTLIIGPDGTLKHVILTRRSDYPHLLDAFIGHTLGLLSESQMEQRIVAPSMSRSSPKTMAQRHREAARLLRDNELNVGSERELLQAAKLDPASTPIRIDLADLYIHLGRYEQADSLLQTILAADANHRGAQLLWGISQFHRGKLEQAEKTLLEALVMNPDPERTQYFLGMIYERRGDLEKAVLHYRGALDRMLRD